MYRVRPVMVGVWQVNATAVFKDWFDQGLNHAQRQSVRVVVDLLADRGTGLGDWCTMHLSPNR